MRHSSIRFAQRSGFTDPSSPSMDSRLLDILVCPVCKGPLTYRRSEAELVCSADRLAFPIIDGIPVMIEEDARKFDPIDEAG